MKHISLSSKEYIAELVGYFARVRDKYARFNLSTHFAAKKFVINEKDLTVRAYGDLISHFGREGVERQSVIYGLEYEWLDGKLLLKKFMQLKKPDPNASSSSVDSEHKYVDIHWQRKNEEDK